MPSYLDSLPCSRLERSSFAGQAQLCHRHSRRDINKFSCFFGGLFEKRLGLTVGQNKITGSFSFLRHCLWAVDIEVHREGKATTGKKQRRTTIHRKGGRRLRNGRAMKIPSSGGAGSTAFYPACFEGITKCKPNRFLYNI